MNKPLFFSNKTVEVRREEEKASSHTAQGAAVSAPQQDAQKSLDGAAIGAYGPAANPPIELSQKTWDESKKYLPWSDDPKSRLAIRTFSRGVMGAAFFTAGGFLTKKWTKHYDTTKPFSAQTNPSSFIAKLIDTVVGAPIEAVVGSVAGKKMAKKAVSFRQTNYPEGRTLGHEAVNITFDFFCASVGDAWGRDIAGWFDPNVKKEWTDDKGRIKAPEAINTALKSTTRYLTYNGGEDWAVAIPYAYFMKGQRSLINKVSPGFKYDFDHHVFGGSFKVQGGHPVPGVATVAAPKVVGSFVREGMLDLQSRFTVYNIGTLMYRELYDYLGDKLSGSKDRLYGAPDKVDSPDRGIADKAGDVAKWVARSAIKGVIVMTPSVPFFWINRSNQFRDRSLFINPEHGLLVNEAKNGQILSVYANDVKLNQELVGRPVFYSKHSKDQWSVEPTQGRPIRSEHLINNPASSGRFHPFRAGRNGVDRAFDKIAYRNYKAAHSLDGVGKWADNNLGAFGANAKMHMGIPSFNMFTQRMVNASVAYTPYMYAKAEFANMWDNGKMDLAAERLIDGAASFNWREVKAGAGEVWNTILQKPLDDPSREAEGQRRIRIDTSAADVFNQTQAQIDDSKKKALSTWRERIISGHPEEKKSITPKDIKAQAAKNVGFAEQEAMRKALEELSPPTNSVH